MKIIALLRRRTPLGWLQLKREPARLLAAVAGIAFADLLMFLQLGVLSSLYFAAVQLQRGLHDDVILVSPQARDINNSGTIPRARLYQAMGFKEVVAGEAVDISFLDWKSPIDGNRRTMTLVAVDPDGSAFLDPAIARQTYKLKLLDTVIFDRKARGHQTALLAELDRQPLVNAEIQRRTIAIAGTFSLGAGFGSDGTMIVSPETFRHFLPQRVPGSITLGLLRLRPGTDHEVFVKELDRHLLPDVSVYSRAGYLTFAKNWQTTNSPIAIIFGAGTFMGFLMGIAMVYQILSSDVNDHLAEYAVFKAMGYTDGYLTGVIFEESLILAGIGYGPGLFAGVLMYAGIVHLSSLPLAMTWARAIGVFCLTLGLSIVSGYLASRKVRKADPAEIFA